MGNRSALTRDRRRHAAEHGLTVEHTGRHPLRKVRIGDRVQVREGEVLTVVSEDGAVTLGHVQAGQAGVFVLEADAAALAAKVAAAPAPLVEQADPVDQLDDTLAAVRADRQRAEIPGHPHCERLP